MDTYDLLQARLTCPTWRDALTSLLLSRHVSVWLANIVEGSTAADRPRTGLSLKRLIGTASADGVLELLIGERRLPSEAQLLAAAAIIAQQPRVRSVRLRLIEQVPSGWHSKLTPAFTGGLQGFYGTLDATCPHVTSLQVASAVPDGTNEPSELSALAVLAQLTSISHLAHTPNPSGRVLHMSTLTALTRLTQLELLLTSLGSSSSSSSPADAAVNVRWALEQLAQLKRLDTLKLRLMTRHGPRGQCSSCLSGTACGT